jgi:hypothetical protein
MSKVKKILVATTLGLILGTGSLFAAKSLVDWVVESYVIGQIVDFCFQGACWVAAKVWDQEWVRTDDSFKNVAADSSLPGYKRVKMPKLVRHENFIVLKNVSQGQWTFQVAKLSKEESGRKNEGSKLANLAESGTVTVFRPHLKGKRIDYMECVGVLAAGGDKLALEPGLDYVVFPNYAKKYRGLANEDNFYRTVYLEDAKGSRYACNLTRLKADAGKIKFGVTANSMGAVMNNKGLEMDPNNPVYDDMFFITQASITTPPNKPN